MVGSATQSRRAPDQRAENENEPSAASTRQRFAFWLGVAAVATLVIGAAWLVITGLLARSQLQDVRSELPQLRQAVLDNRMPEARRLADRIRTQAARAHALTTGPAWWVAANLPAAGAPLNTTRVLTRAADQLGDDVVPTVVRLADEVSRARANDASIDLTPIRRLAPELHRAALIVARTRAAVAGSAGSWFGPVSSARSSVLAQLTDVDGELGGADRAVRIALPMLGDTGERRYFVGFMNEAEARGTGGILGAYAIATVKDGHLHFDHFGSDTDFAHVRADVDLGADYTALYGQDDPAGVSANSDISPDFRDAGRIWTGLWKAKTGESLDGAIALDPTTLGYLLGVTGPARTVDGRIVDAGSVVALTQKDLYARFGSGSAADDAARKQYVVQLVRAISGDLGSGGDAHGLVRAFSRAATERRFLVWSADPRIEAQLVAAGWAGALDPRPGSVYTGFVVNNAAGSKLDYYLERRMTYRRSGCSGRSVATMTLTNTAPATGLPRYVTIRADRASRASRPGDNRLLVTYYATPGARINGVTLDGAPVGSTQLTERGLVTVTTDLELPVGASRTLRVSVDEPAGAHGVQVLRQPGVQPLAVTVDGPSC